MLVVMRSDAAGEEISSIIQTIEELGFQAREIRGVQRTAIGIVGSVDGLDESSLRGLPGVSEIIRITRPFKLVSREWKPENTVVAVSDCVSFGGKSIPIIAGPCSVESEAQIIEAATVARAAGATLLRGGAFKPRSSPYSFQGLGIDGLKLLARARELTGLPIVTEAIDPQGINIVSEYADIVQIGARNMQNYSLLKEAGKIEKPILLKRGLASTITELLLSAEYILTEGNDRVILCERGIRGFDTPARNIFDLTSIPIIQGLSHLPIIADPSHGTGSREYVPSMALAAVAAGADGLMVEMHPDPARALSDGAQSLYPAQLTELVTQIKEIASTIGREVAALATATIGT